MVINVYFEANLNRAVRQVDKNADKITNLPTLAPSKP